MPEIVFKGKEYGYNYHLSVPYRPLMEPAAKGVCRADLKSNLMIPVDNFVLVFDQSWRADMDRRFFGA